MEVEWRSVHLLYFFPYKFPEDLPRYQYAYLRWVKKTKMPPSSWKFKIQHDTLQQAFFNAVGLATPIMMCTFNKSESISPLEVFGWCSWMCCWSMESWADVQKNNYLINCKKLAAKEPERKAELKSACLGHGEFAKPAYFLWTWCRHPNYFFEWMCWNSCIISAIPSLISLAAPLWVKVCLAVNLLMLSRLFYDCLMYWTGSEPAEHFSVAKRPSYKEYQKTTNVLFPHQLDFITSFFFNHRRNGFEALPQDSKKE